MINDSRVKYYMPADSDLEDYAVGAGYIREAQYSDVSVNNSVYHEGAGSAQFNGTNSQLLAELHEGDDLNFRTDKFTIAFWVRFISLKDSQFISYSRFYGYWNTSEEGWRCWYDNTNHRLYFQYYDVENSSWLIDLYCDWSPSINTWYEIRLARDGADFWITIDGVFQSLTGTPPDASTDIDIQNEEFPSIPAIIWVGVRYVILTHTHHLDGYIDDLWVAREVVRLGLKGDPIWFGMNF